MQQTRANQASQRSRSRLPDHPSIPEVVGGLYLGSDVKKLDDAYKRARLNAANASTPAEAARARREYERVARRLEAKTPDERITEIREAYKKAARSLGGTSVRDLYEYGSTRQRRQMRETFRQINAYEAGQAQEASAKSGIPVGRDTVRAGKARTRIPIPGVGSRAGIPVGDVLHSVGSTLDERTRIPGKASASLADVAAIGPNLIRATAEAPGAVFSSSVRTGVESITGIPQGVKEMLTDPKGALKSTVEDYERRYGPILNNPAEFRRRVKEESGLTPFVLDAAALGVPVGRAATMLARSGPAGRAALALGRVADRRGTLRPLADFAETTHRAARAPRDAKRLSNLRSELERARAAGDTAEQARLRKAIRHQEGNVRATERPALRYSGGEGGVREQPSSPNLIVGLGQRGLDRSRRRAHEKMVRRAGWKPGPGGRIVSPEMLPERRTVENARESSERLLAEGMARPDAWNEYQAGARRRTQQLTKRRAKTGIVEFEELFARKLERDLAQARKLGLHANAAHLRKLIGEVRQVASVAARAAARAGHESGAQRVLMEHWTGKWDGPAPKPLKRGGAAKLQRFGALRPGEREVIPKTTGLVGRSGRELPGLRRYTGRVARDLGGGQSTTRIKLLTHRGRVLHQVNRAFGKLDENESASLKYMLQLGATPDQAGVRVLEARRDQIMEARAKKKTRIASVLEDSNDELALIDRILASPADFLTPRARRAATELREIQLGEARRDPELSPAQELTRRVTPQGRALGVERGPDAEFFRGVLAEIDAKAKVPGVAAHADALANLHPSLRGEAAEELLRPVRTQRKRAERDVVTADRRVAVARARIAELKRRDVPLTTPEVTRARAELARAKRARAAAGRRVTRAERRAGAALGRLEGRERAGGPVPTPEVRDARRVVSRAQRRVNALQDRIAGVERKAGRALGYAEGRKIPPGRVQKQIVEFERQIKRARTDARKKDLRAKIDELRRSGGEQRRPNERALEAELDSGELQRLLTAAKSDLREAQTSLRGVEAAAPRLTRAQLEGGLGRELDSVSRSAELTEAETRVAAAKAALADVQAGAPRVPTAVHTRLDVRERELASAKHVRENTRAFEKALKKVVRASKSERNMRLEDAESFAARVREAAEAAGLEEPAYWWSSLMPRESPSLAAAGRGTRAAHGNKPYKGKLFDIGAEEHTPDVFTRGIERNIKRRFQQALVVRNLETHAYEWSRGVHGAGLTIAELEKLMIDRAIDPKTIELVDPRVLRRRAPEMSGTERGRLMSPDELDPETTMLPDDLTDEDFVSTTQQHLADARRRWEEVSHDELARQAQHRFLVVPREVGETLDGVSSKMDNTFWRAAEIVLKQKPARILLGAANVPWLAFQIASNAMLTGLGGGINPWNIHGAHKWFKALTPDEREAVEAELGITHGHHFGMDQPHLGATNLRMVSFWRAYKKSRVGRYGPQTAPRHIMDLMFKADEKQNNFFRRVLFYDRARKEAYRRMGHSWKGIDTAMTRAMDRVMARPPHQQVHLIARHGAEFEAVAKHVNNFLGDYLRFTPAERFALQRNVMFYGYLRFSLRFAFYTMPVAHPVMAAIMANIGRMGAGEIKDLMGVPDNYQLPTSILAQTYFGTRKDAEGNELRSLPLGRFNPFLNALTQLDGLQQAIGVVSPFYQMLVDQAFEESSFTGRDWRIGGRPTPAESERPRDYYGSAQGLLNPGAYDFPGHEGSPRNRIAENAVLNLAYPYRVATQTGIPGIAKPLEPNQSDDALLWRPQPMTYADKDAAKGVRKSRRDFEREGAGRRLAGSLLPVFPKRTASPAVVARELEREAAIRKRNRTKPGTKKKRKRKAAGRSYSTRSSNRRTYSTGGSSGSRYR